MDVQQDATSRADQRDARRAQILAVGLEVFVARGFAGTKVADIADAAGMSTGLLFHYFPSKRALYEELVRGALARSATTVAALSVEAPLASFAGVADALLTHLAAERRVALTFVLVSRAQADGLLADEVGQRTRATLDHSAAVIAAGQTAGVFRPGGPRALAIAFWGAVQGISELAVLEDQPPWPEASWLIDILRARAETAQTEEMS